MTLYVTLINMYQSLPAGACHSDSYRCTIADNRYDGEVTGTMKTEPVIIVAGVECAKGKEKEFNE